jgi:uncharacterized membrane protein YoaK (UPF0700 family)
VSERPAVVRLLLALTFITGIVDAVSFLGLGRTFVANMTGNVVLLGFGIAGAPGISLAAVLVAFFAFLAGAVAGGRLTRWREAPVVHAVTIELTLIALAAVTAIGLHAGQASDRRYLVIGLLAVAMGVRNAVVKTLGVRDLTTTVLTLTSTSLAADSPLGGGDGAGSPRKLAGLGVMLLGAFLGALLVLHNDLWLPLLGAAVVLAAALAAYVRAEPGAIQEQNRPSGS